MTTNRALPTLTEVIEVGVEALAPAEPRPLAPDSIPLDAAPAAPSPPVPDLPRLSLLGPEEATRIVDAVVARLQPRLDAWVREQIGAALQDSVQQALDDAVRQAVDGAAADVARRLRSELPALARAALDEVRPDSFES